MRKYCFAIVLLLCFGLIAQAQQLTSVTIGVDGLHCSACTFSVEKSLNRLDFVEYVQMDLNERVGEVILKKEVPIDFTKLAKAVSDAGFSVRDFYLNLKQSPDLENTCLEVEAHHFCILNMEKTKEEQRLQIIGKPFMAKSAFKKWKKNQPEWSCADCSKEEDRSFFANFIR